MKKNHILSLIAVFFIGSYLIISCRHEPPMVAPTAYTFTYGSWSSCVGDTQTRSYTSNPLGGIPSIDSIKRYCGTTPPPSCTFVYSTWGTCTGDTQRRTYTTSPTGCTGVPPVDSIKRYCGVVNPCAGVTINVTTTSVQPTIGQSNGSITVTSPLIGYTYSKDGVNFSPVTVFSNLPAGPYTITAKNSSGCTGSTIVVLVGTCTGVQINVTPTPTQPTNGANGSISVSATGGVAPYQYSIDGGAYVTTFNFTSLASGVHSISVKDANGCSGAPSSVTLNCPTITVTGTPTHPTNGANGSISASAAGGVAPYQYSIDGGAFGSTSNFTSLSSGVHTISAKDANGCTSSTANVTLNCPTITVTGTASSSRTNCSNNTIVVSTANGGISPYTYNKDGGTYQASTTFTPLAGGTYTITAKDSKGCIGSNTVTINAAATVHFATDIKPIINNTCGRANLSCHNHSNAWTSYSDIVGTSTGTTTWSSNLLTFIQRARGTSTSTNCVYSSSGQHNMPPTNTSAWTTFIQGVFTNWVNQGYPNN